MDETKKPTAARKPAKKAAKKPAAKPDPPQVYVRMYCHGLGDCFLLRFEPAEGEVYHALIDCGVYKAAADADALMTEVAEDIRETTKGKLDLLVVTHEHWDHISGFHQAREVFDKMAISEVWQPWTENPRHGLATTLRKKYEAAKTKLVELMEKAAEAPGAARSAALNEAFEVMSFLGIERPAAKGGAKADGDGDGGTREDPYVGIRKLLAANNPRYLSPGDVQPVGKTGVMAFVLGPPASETSLRKKDIAKADAFERKHLGFFDGLDAVLGAAEAGLAGDSAGRSGNPFDARQEVPVAVARDGEFFRSVYPSPDDAAHPEAFRSIDDLAFESLGRLALRMDSYTNNTSLVLAFRLPSGDVLLFPGDAQGGNWKSWADAADGPLAFPDEKTDARKLLAATVLYKVSHHGSHNATPRTYGLDRMTSPQLRAFVPVDAATVKQARYGQMPLRAIMTALGERAGGVFRGDRSDLLPPGFKLSAKTLPIRATADADPVDRPMYCETSFDLR